LEREGGAAFNDELSGPDQVLAQLHLLDRTTIQGFLSRRTGARAAEALLDAVDDIAGVR